MPLPAVYNFDSVLPLKIWTEQIAGKGEDAPPTLVTHSESGLIAVYDGLGGAGSKRYHLPNQQEASGAYLASRFAKQVLEEAFRKTSTLPSYEELKAALVQKFKAELALIEQETSKLRSKLIRRFPTTLAAIHYQQSEQRLLITSLWAGDSRNYLQNRAQGLIQISEDDLKGKPDALQNLSEDATIANCISAEGDFQLHHCHYEADEPILLITASDGCFAYLPSPMHFEYILLDTLMQSHYDLEDWQDKLQEALSKPAADDCSLALVAWGFESLEALKSYFLPRYQELKQKYIEPLASAQNTANYADKRQALWNSYRQNYYYFEQEEED